MDGSDGLHCDAREFVLNGDVFQVGIGDRDGLTYRQTGCAGEGAVLDQNDGSCVIMEIVLQNLHSQKPLVFAGHPSGQCGHAAGQVLVRLENPSLHTAIENAQKAYDLAAQRAVQLEADLGSREVRTEIGGMVSSVSVQALPKRTVWLVPSVKVSVAVTSGSSSP